MDTILDLNKENFRNILRKYHKEYTLKYFNISQSRYRQLVKEFNAEDIIEEIKQEKRKLALQHKSLEKFNKLKEDISKDDLIDFYINKNHTLKETCLYFNVTQADLLKLIKEYNCKKPKTISSKISKQTKLDRYGTTGYNNRNQARLTCIEKYGVENVAQVKEFSDKGYQTKCEHYGADNPNNWKKGQETRIINAGSIEESYKIGKIHKIDTCFLRYGVKNTSQLNDIKDKIRESSKKTFLEKYGVECYWLLPDAKRSSGSKNSSYNIAFSNLLSSFDLTFSSEFILSKFIYDFKINNTLIEINPFPTHNSTWNPYSNISLDKNYHRNKTKTAIDASYRCIHIWDWDDQEKIVKSLLPKKAIYARKCEIREISKIETNAFLNEYHYQNTCKNQKISYGLYSENELVQVMTFGKPRYNKNYEYELLRLCTKNDYKIIGGAERLFKYFIKNNKPNSIISYCDNSKFTGDVYFRLGMNLKDSGIPTKHWYNNDLKIHITDNFLRQRGFDQLFGDRFGCYGKGSDNDALMIAHGFVEIYDCGQSVYIWKKEDKNV